MNDLYINSVIEWVNNGENSQLERILWINPVDQILVTIDLLNSKAMPVLKNISEIDYALTSGTARITEVKVDGRVIIDIPEKHARFRNEAWNLIEPLVKAEPNIYIPRFRGELVAKRVSETGKHKSTVYGYLRRYWQNGKIVDALLPNFYQCGGPGRDRGTTSKKKGRPKKVLLLEPEHEGINVDEDVRKHFRIAIRRWYMGSKKFKLKQVYDKMIGELFNVGYRFDEGVKYPVLPPAHELPTYRQFLYWYKKEFELPKVVRSREGEAVFNLKHREVVGESTSETFGPGCRFQIDATIADVYLVSRFNRRWIIGRPVIYAVIDVFSRFVVGVYIGLEGPSWIGAMMALANTAADKVAFCAEYGIQIKEGDWPCSHLPELLTADRGELAGKKPAHLVKSLGVDVQILPPYRADWKGIIEQHFNLCKVRSIQWLPGAVRDRERERTQRDYRLDAKLDLYQFTEIILRAILYHNLDHILREYDRNEFMVAQDVKLHPIKIWNWGLKNRTGRLRKFPIDIVMLNLMPRDTATITHRGIIFKCAAYSCEKALKENWFQKARIKGSWQVEVCHDPRSVDFIYIPSGDGRIYEKCYMLESCARYKGKRLEEVLDLLAIEQMEIELGMGDEQQSRLKLNAHIDHIVSEATQLTEVAKPGDLSNRQRLAGIRDNRRVEKERNRENESWELGNQAKKKSKKGNVVIKDDVFLVGDDEYVPPAKDTSLLMNSIKKRKGQGDD